ncbi:MAG: LCP family protein, partial [Candidatus Limnocylindria bacterium]
AGTARSVAIAARPRSIEQGVAGGARGSILSGARKEFQDETTRPNPRSMIRRDQPARAQARRNGRAAPPPSYDPEALAAWRRGDPAWARAGGPRRRSIGRTILTILLLALVALLAGALLLWARVSAFNDRVSSAPALSSSLFLPLQGEERVNVLMVGYGGAEHEGGFLADSIIILSIDPATETTTTVPIPRDMWIEGMAELPDNAKVNEAFAIGHQGSDIPGGAQLLAEVLSQATGLTIEHWLAIDFDGFREMVDAVGGVTVTNPVAFSYTVDAQLHSSAVWTDGTFEAGEISLDGAQALAYTRARYTSVVAESSDFARSVRQQRILSALKAKLGDGGLASLGPGLRLMDALETRLTTDLSAIDLFLLSGHLTSDRRVELAEGEALTATTNTIGQYILIPVGWTGPGDYDGLQAYLDQRLAEPIPAASPSPASTAP